MKSGDDGDAARFEIAVFQFFGVKGLLDFAADPACLARLYFVDLLAKTFLWMFRNNAGLPFNFSRFLWNYVERRLSAYERGAGGEDL